MTSPLVTRPPSQFRLESFLMLTVAILSLVAVVAFYYAN